MIVTFSTSQLLMLALDFVHVAKAKAIAIRRRKQKRVRCGMDYRAGRIGRTC